PPRLRRWAVEVPPDPAHGPRLALDSYLTDLARDLQHDPSTRTRAEALKVRILDHPQAATTAVSLWEAVKVVLVDALDDAGGHVRGRLVAELRTFAVRVQREEGLRQRLDAWGADAVAALVDRYGAELTTVISSTIDRWDGKEAAERIELHVGRDLQFIRINGTVVGALVGLLLHTGSQLLSPIHLPRPSVSSRRFPPRPSVSSRRYLPPANTPARRHTGVSAAGRRPRPGCPDGVVGVETRCPVGR